MRDVVENCGVELLGGVTVNEFDSFHELIAHEETCRFRRSGLRRWFGCRVGNWATAGATVWET